MKDISEVILAHFKSYPLMTARDIYKLVFQAAMGPGHAVTDHEMTKKYLDFEIKNMEDHTDEEITEIIRHDAGLVRVNLRPFIKYGGCAEKLCSAFIETANSFEQDRSSILKFWETAEELSLTKKIPLEKNEIESFFLFVESKGFPAAHHSTVYRDNYKPAYRVVSKKLYESICPKKRLTSN